MLIDPDVQLPQRRASPASLTHSTAGSAFHPFSSAVMPAADVAQRQAFIGFAASVTSDTVSNSLRVVKTYRQVHEGSVGYRTSGYSPTPLRV